MLLAGDGVDSVRRLKASDGEDLSVIGSAALVHALHAAGLVDTYQLLIHPLTLGAGARLFGSDGPMTEFRLDRSVTTSAGVIIAEYRRA